MTDDSMNLKDQLAQAMRWLTPGCTDVSPTIDELLKSSFDRDYLGEHFLAWNLLEPIWIGGSEFEAVAAAAPRTLFQAADERAAARDQLLFADLFGWLGTQLADSQLLPSLLCAGLLRQSIFSLDLAALTTAETKAELAFLETTRSIRRLAAAAQHAASALEGPGAALLLGLSIEDIAALDEFQRLDAETNLKVAEPFDLKGTAIREMIAELAESGDVDASGRLRDLIARAEEQWQAIIASDLGQHLIGILRQLRESPQPIERMLRDADNRLHENYEAQLALGTYLALTGHAHEALPHIEKAVKASSGAPQHTEIIAHYMHTDCLCELLHTFPEDIVSLLAREVTNDDADLWDDFERWWDNEPESYLFRRGCLIRFGDEDPWSSESDLILLLSHRTKIAPPSQVPVPIPSPAVLLDAVANTPRTPAIPEGPTQSPSGGAFLMAVREMWRQDMAEAAQASENRIRTDIGGLRSDTRERWSREQYLTEQIAALMPRAKRQSVIDDLRSSIARWSDLPASAKDQLTAAAYLSGDPVLNTAEAVSSILLAVGKAVEVTGKELLRKGPGFRLRYLIETLETDPNPRPWVGDVRELNDLRNEAAHGSRSLTRAHVERAWQLLRGTASSPGILDNLVRHAKDSARRT